MVSIAYNRETINFFSKVIATSIAQIDDSSCEEKAPESEESEKNEKNEKTSFSDDLFLNRSLISAYTELWNLRSKQYINFSSSDYTQVVYSPPEFI